MYDHLTGLVSFFPWNLIIALFFAFTFAVIGISIFRYSIRKREASDSPREPHPFLEKCKTAIAQFGYFPASSFSKSFVHALNIMSSFVGGRQFRYQLPWIVMLGTREAGKSTILQSLDLDRPIGRPHFNDESGDKPLCDWWFYDHGIVLDVDGKLVLNQSQVNSDEENWQQFLNLLTHHRPKRPLDGIVLTLPASEFVGQTALSHDDIMVRAEYLYGKLWNMQRVTGMRLPVYLVITKCDLVPGFESFCRSIPTHNRHDLFGWSNDEAVDVVYNSSWIDLAFASINASLYRAQEEIYTSSQALDERNGIFMLPLSFNTLKGGIRTYANHLFKESSYHESFFLRGIYFVGESHLERPLSLKSTPSLNIGDEADPLRSNIYFADNIFEKKVFREVGLARPVSQVLLGNTRAMRVAKVGVAIAAIIGTLGLLNANEELQEAKTSLAPALTQVASTLKEIRNKDNVSESNLVRFEDQAAVLLNMMTQISVNRLYSTFIPASWISTLDNKIKYVMGLAYDQVIIRAMARELDNIATKLIMSLHNFIPATEVPHDGINPLTTLEWYHLRNYTIAIKELETMANKFNSPHSTINDVGELLKYLFNYEAPQSFYDNDEYYLEAITRSHVDFFNFSKYSDPATIKLRKLFEEFQLASFNPYRTIPGLEKLQTSIANFSGTQNYAAYDIELLRDIFLSLKQTVQSIDDPGFNWLDADHFEPGHPYDTFKNILYTSQFFTPQVAGLPAEADRNFIKFRGTLLEFKSSLFNDESLFKGENGLAISSTSPGALNLLKNLDSFFKEPFMAPTKDKMISTNVPIGTTLFWDSLRLQEATRLIKIYTDFMNAHFLDLPKALQPILQKVAREGLTKNLISFIADAQIFNADIIQSSRLVPEDALLPQVQNYRAVAPFLENLLFALKANNANTAFSALKNVLTVQAYGLIEKLDHILADESPYAIKFDSFEWWNGKPLAALEAFSVLNLNELKHYLELQRTRINYLAREFAGPLVDFLAKINGEGMPGNLPLLAKWEGIINELAEYDRKAPGNGLVALENYIMYPLTEVTLETCNKYANMASMLAPGEDFFLSILVHIQEKLHEQCVDLSGALSMETFNQLSDFFNANLAGKFPFTENACPGSPDANPEDIRAFFDLLDNQAAGIAAVLKEATKLGVAGKNALTFIEQMEKVRLFFGGFLAPESPLSTPAFSFDVTFRVNREQEVNGNAILDWELRMLDAPITMRSPSHIGYWEAGKPVEVAFRWALNSTLQPMIIEGMPNFDVRGDTAVFSYDGVWALLRLLRQHQALPSDLKGLNDKEPITLRFDIPLTNVISNRINSCRNELEKASVFIRLKVSPLMRVPSKVATPAVKGEPPLFTQEKLKMGTPGTLPYFPTHAPHLHAKDLRP